MEIGRCPRCTTPYTASEIAGFGILRARAARAGGPRMEYTCQQCGRLIHLIPHGDGRYAPPGEPPPPAVPEAQRRPPWVDGVPPGTPAEPFEVPVEPPPEAAAEEPRAGPADRGGAQRAKPLQDTAPDTPMSAGEALELLGVTPSADPHAIERAFRERSLLCHPDKVAHLDAEFQELAERKFKRLRRAYDLLTS